MFVRVRSDHDGKSRNKITVPRRAIEVPNRVFEKRLDPLCPRIQNYARRTICPGIVKRERGGFNESDSTNEFNICKGSITSSQRMPLLVC
jgi:hypothetical protein